jgi:hypothetical protein
LAAEKESEELIVEVNDDSDCEADDWRREVSSSLHVEIWKSWDLKKRKMHVGEQKRVQSGMINVWNLFAKEKLKQNRDSPVLRNKLVSELNKKDLWLSGKTQHWVPNFDVVGGC